MNLLAQLADKIETFIGIAMSIKKTFFSWFFWGVSCLSLTQCALLGGGGEKINRADEYKLSAPSDWRELSNRGESDRAYRLPSGNKVSVTSFCDRNREASLRVLTRQVLIGTRNIRVLDEQDIAVERGSGLFTHVQTSAEGKTLFLGIGIIKKMGCVFDFSLVSSQAISPGEKNAFLNFIKSLHYGND